MPTVLSQELQDKIDDIKKRQTRIETNLQTSKDGVKEALVDSIMKVMSSDDFLNNQDYLSSSLAVGSVPAGVLASEAKQRAYVKSLSRDEQINLLAEYSIDAEREQGHNDWEKELVDAQKAKEITKKAVAVQAKAVIESFKNLTVEHEKLITELKGKVKTKKAEIKEKDNDLKEIENQITANMKAMQASKNYTPTPEQIDEAKKAIEGLTNKRTKLEGEREELKGDLSDLETNLADMEEQRDTYKAEIEQAISELEESLKMEGIYVGSYEGLGEKSSSETENEESANIEASSASGQGGIDERKPKDIAKAMMTDFRNLAPEEIMEMVEHTGYGDLLNMSRELGPINRINLEKVMKNRLQDLENGLEATIKDSNGNDKVIRLSLEDLEDLSDLDDNKFNKVKKIMKYYTDNYQTMAVHERQEAERVMNYLKIANLLTESQRGKISRFVGRFTEKGTRINEIGNSLRRFATERGKREAKKWERNQDIRTRLSFKTPIPSTTRKKHIDRSGDKPIQREYGD